MNDTPSLPIVVEFIADGVMQFRLNRPARLNALSQEAVVVLKENIDAAYSKGARVLLLRGTGRAFEMMYAGEPISAQTAATWGLVNGTVDDAELDAHVADFSALLAAKSRRSAAVLKRTVYSGVDVSLEDGLEIERNSILDVFGSRDYAEGLAAFSEKRAPVFHEKDQ